MSSLFRIQTLSNDMYPDLSDYHLVQSTGRLFLLGLHPHLLPMILWQW